MLDICCDSEEEAYMDIAQGKYEKALAYFKSIKQTAKTVHTIALIYATMAQWDGADENFARALEIKQDGFVNYNWGVSFMKRKKIPEATAMFKKAIKQERWWWLLWEPGWFLESKKALLKIKDIS